MVMLLLGYRDIEFPATSSIVYVIYFEKNGKKIYFYVGQSSTRHIGRLGDYVSAQFTASRDFIVGEAIKYLRKRGLPIRVLYKESLQPKLEESKLIRALSSSYILLNNHLNYDYRKSDEVTERRKIQGFIDQILSSVDH